LPNGKDVNSIRYYAQKRGMKTAIVSVKNITDATPAVFLSHADHRSELFNIAAQMPFSGCDVILGGGLSHFVPGTEGGDVVIRDAAGKETVVKGSRDDGKNVVDDIKAQGYTFVTTKEDMLKSDADKLFGLFDPGIMNTAPDTPEPTLTDMTMKAIEIISKNNKNGFFIMSEAGCIDSGNHGNNHDYALQEMLEFNNTIKACLDFAKKDGETLIVITADHDTGVCGAVDPSDHAKEVGRNTSAVYATGGHSANWVPVFAYGPGAEYFTGVMQNNSIPRRFANFWGLDLVKLAKEYINEHPPPGGCFVKKTEKRSDTMKKLIFAMLLTAALCGSASAAWLGNYNLPAATASVEGPAALRAGATGTVVTAVSVTYSNTADNGWSSYMPAMNPFGIVVLLKDNTPPQSNNDLYIRSISKDNDFEDIYFAVFVADASVNPDVTFNVWGGNATYVEPLVGQQWYVYVNDEYVDTFVWDADHLSKTNPIYSLYFDGAEVNTLANAAIVRLSTTSPFEPEPEVPEPATAAYALMGLGSLAGIKRKFGK
ncbi:MAG: alkaline phosphatase, partial [Abditibacteriota bacterium]|nr:alkaline phosphatase [Abditibacteriota bacterium]